MLYSWADSKKKFNLMLSTFACGRDAIKWIGDLKNLGIGTNAFELERKAKSYQQSVIVWIKQAALQSDMQKVCYFYLYDGYDFRLRLLT